MLSFKTENGRFNFRTAAVIRHDGRILIHRGVQDSFWTLPGGRVEFGESAEAALEREIKEELQAEAKALRLLWIVENFFTYQDEPYHELSFYFEVLLPPGSPLLDLREPFPGLESGTDLIFQWHPLDRLNEIKLLPSFLHKKLKEISNEIQYIKHFDSKNKNNYNQSFKIDTQRLFLRKFELSDLDGLHSLFTSPGIRKFLWDDTIISLEKTKEILEKNLEIFEQHRYGLWSVLEATQHQLIGFCGYWHFREPPELELLYGIAEEFWSQGYATEAARAVLDYGFNKLGFKEIIASTDAPNLASIRVMQKLGMLFHKRETKDGLDTIYYRATT